LHSTVASGRILDKREDGRGGALQLRCVQLDPIENIV